MIVEKTQCSCGAIQREHQNANWYDEPWSYGCQHGHPLVARLPQMNSDVTDSHAQSADALVVFGATGNLAYKKIFSALYTMAQNGALKVPVIGVASSKWSVEQWRTRARESIKHIGGEVDPHMLGNLLTALQYDSGNYKDATTFDALRLILHGAHAQRSTSRSHLHCSPRSSAASRPPAWPKAGESSSKSRSAVIWPRHANSTRSHWTPSPKTPSSALITSWAKKRS